MVRPGGEHSCVSGSELPLSLREAVAAAGGPQGTEGSPVKGFGQQALEMCGIEGEWSERTSPVFPGTSLVFPGCSYGKDRKQCFHVVRGRAGAARGSQPNVHGGAAVSPTRSSGTGASFPADSGFAAH